MMTLEEMKLAMCEKLPESIGRFVVNSGEFYGWKSTTAPINWPTEGLQVCHEAEKLLWRHLDPYKNERISYNAELGNLTDGEPFHATYEQRLEALCRVWFPERF